MQSFQELKLSEPVMRAIGELGYATPSPIQAQALPILLGKPTDFIGLAATGTGKTAAFSIPLLEQLNPKLAQVQALVLCPTRELAMQVCGQVALLGKHLGVRALAIYGGADYRQQFEGLRRGAHIIVGTPGRVIDHLERGSLRLDNIRTLVLDEADEMISMGFRDELEIILKQTPRQSSQTWLFSATMSRDVRKVADTYLRQPQQVQVNRTEMLSGTVEQIYYLTKKESNKPEIICRLIDAADDFYGIIFCQTKLLVTDLTKYLAGRSYRVDCLHGDMEQKARERTMQAFRNRKVNILVCTDVASRGLDVKDITHVINFSLPRELDSYVHRIGRTARSGKKGVAMSLVTPSHFSLIYRLQDLTKSRMVEGRIPSHTAVGKKKALILLQKFMEEKSHVRAAEILGNEWAQILESMDALEVASRFIAMLSPDLFSERNLAGTSSDEHRPRSPASPRHSTPRQAQGRHAPRRHRGDRPHSRHQSRDKSRFRG